MILRKRSSAMTSNVDCTYGCVIEEKGVLILFIYELHADSGRQASEVRAARRCKNRADVTSIHSGLCLIKTLDQVSIGLSTTQ